MLGLVIRQNCTLGQIDSSSCSAVVKAREGGKLTRLDPAGGKEERGKKEGAEYGEKSESICILLGAGLVLMKVTFSYKHKQYAFRLLCLSLLGLIGTQMAGVVVKLCLKKLCIN